LGLIEIIGIIGAILILTAFILNPYKRGSYALWYGNLFALQDTPILALLAMIGVVLLILAGILEEVF
jgi:hypothetical protein